MFSIHTKAGDISCPFKTHALPARHAGFSVCIACFFCRSSVFVRSSPFFSIYLSHSFSFFHSQHERNLLRVLFSRTFFHAHSLTQGTRRDFLHLGFARWSRTKLFRTIRSKRYTVRHRGRYVFGFSTLRLDRYRAFSWGGR